MAMEKYQGGRMLLPERGGDLMGVQKPRLETLRVMNWSGSSFTKGSVPKMADCLEVG